MKHEVLFYDRVMLGALMLLTFFMPYSPAVVQGCLFVLMAAWIKKYTLAAKRVPAQGPAALFNLPYHHILWALLIIGSLILLTLPWSHAPALSLKKFFSRFSQQIFLMFCVIEVIKTPKRLYMILGVLLCTMFIINTDVFLQIFYGHSFIFLDHMMNSNRVTGPMRHPNDLGTILVTTIPIVLSLFLTWRSWTPILFGQRYGRLIATLCVVLFLGLVVSLGFSLSRGAWVAFFLSMGAFIFLIKNWYLRISVIVLIIVFFWLFSIFCIDSRNDISPSRAQSSTANIQVPVVQNSSESNQLPDPVPQEVAKISSPPQTTKQILFNPSRRWEYWSLAMDIIKRFPFFGCGYNAYIQTLKKLTLYPVEYPHNSLLQIGAELGLIGLAAHLYFFISLFFYGLRTLKDMAHNSSMYILAVGVFLSIFAWLVHSFLDTPWQSLLLSILWWLLIGILLSLRTVAQHMELNRKRG